MWALCTRAFWFGVSGCVLTVFLLFSRCGFPVVIGRVVFGGFLGVLLAVVLVPRVWSGLVGRVSWWDGCVVLDVFGAREWWCVLVGAVVLICACLGAFCFGGVLLVRVGGFLVLVGAFLMFLGRFRRFLVWVLSAWWLFSCVRGALVGALSWCGECCARSWFFGVVCTGLFFLGFRLWG